MTHVTNLGLWVLWLGVGYREARARWPVDALPAWPLGCGNPRGEPIIWADELEGAIPTCPTCAVLCDEARGAA